MVFGGRSFGVKFRYFVYFRILGDRGGMGSVNF